jgi:hypothetical protein
MDLTGTKAELRKLASFLAPDVQTLVVSKVTLNAFIKAVKAGIASEYLNVQEVGKDSVTVNERTGEVVGTMTLKAANRKVEIRIKVV